jgi:hypothetical protein
MFSSSANYMRGANTGNENQKCVGCANGDNDAVVLMADHTNLVAHNLISAGKSSARYLDFDRDINGRHKTQAKTTASGSTEIDLMQATTQRTNPQNGKQ